MNGIPTPAYEPALESPPCPSCPTAQLQAARSDALATCPACGSSWECEPAVAPPRGRREAAVSGRSRKPPAARRRATTVRSLVSDLLAWHLATGQRERTQGGGYAPIATGSPTAGVLRVLETGIVGDGCSGTKGTWRGAAPEPLEVRTLTVDERVTRRYSALRELRAVADAIIEDASGDVVRELVLYRERERDVGVALSLPQRIGWALATEKQRAQWRVKIAKRDSAPALAGMELAGAEALRRLCERWDEMAAEEQREELAAQCRREAGVE